jgi:hypothetical protein
MGDVAADLAGVAAFFFISWLRHRYKASINNKATAPKDTDS